MDELQSRGKALEDVFFGERDKELLGKLKAEIGGKEVRESLRAVSGIDNDEALDKLIVNVPATGAGVGARPLRRWEWQ